MTSQIAVVPSLVKSAQLERPPTVLLKSPTSSPMQVEYSATVAVQVEGTSPQPGLGQTAPGSPAAHEVSLVEQFDLSFSSVGALLEVA